MELAIAITLIIFVSWGLWHLYDNSVGEVLDEDDWED